MRINVTPGQVTSLLNSLGRVTAGKMVLANELTAEETKAIAGLFQPWVVGESVEIGMLRKYENDLYECVQAHTTQADWTPDATPALWTIKSAPGVIPVWIQPTGAQDAYDIGEKVQWPEGGTIWESTINANTTVPGENLAHGYWIEVTG